MDNKLGTIPEFTQDDAAAAPIEQTEVTPEAAPEKDTTAPPPEEITEAPDKEPDNTQQSPEELQSALQGLQQERVKLLKEISKLRGQKREIKQEELRQVDSKLDELADLNPDDVSIIDRVLRAKGYITKEEASKMSYEATKTEELNRFLEKYPEYKPENDPGDVRWTDLQREVGLYRMPDDPRRVGEILERAHRALVKVPSGQSKIAVQQRKIEVAGAGHSGAQRPSESKTLDPSMRDAYRRGGWTEEEINEIEKKL